MKTLVRSLSSMLRGHWRVVLLILFLRGLGLPVHFVAFMQILLMLAVLSYYSFPVYQNKLFMRLKIYAKVFTASAFVFFSFINLTVSAQPPKTSPHHLATKPSPVKHQLTYKITNSEQNTFGYD